MKFNTNMQTEIKSNSKLVSYKIQSVQNFTNKTFTISAGDLLI